MLEGLSPSLEEQLQSEVGQGLHGALEAEPDSLEAGQKAQEVELDIQLEAEPHSPEAEPELQEVGPKVQEATADSLEVAPLSDKHGEVPSPSGFRVFSLRRKVTILAISSSFALLPS